MAVPGEKKEVRHVVVAGAGPSGALAALNFAKRGYKVDLIEKRADFRGVEGDYSGRSINLALSARGRAALRNVGLEEEVLQQAIPMYGRFMHGQDGRSWYQPYGQPHEHILSVGRETINRIVLNAAEKTGNVRAHFNSPCTRVRFRESEINTDHTVEITASIDGESTVLRPDLLVGADGAYSVVRTALQRRKGTNYSQEFLEHGYKELSIPPAKDGNFAIRSDVLHIWPRGQFMMIALPNMDKSFTVTVFLPMSSKDGWCFDKLKTRDDVKEFFTTYFADAVPLMPNLYEDFETNPSDHLMMLTVNPWSYGNTVLVGDACHAVVPFFGQGMNASLQDVDVLMDVLEEGGVHKTSAVGPEQFAVTLHHALLRYDELHRVDGVAIGRLSYDNYLEMRSSVRSNVFLLKKRIELFLNRLFPSRYLPLYSMVSFTTIPYHECIETNEKQQKVVNGIMYTLPLTLGIVAGAALAFSLLPKYSNTASTSAIISKL